MHLPWVHPFTCVINGMTCSGKSFFITKFIKHLHSMVDTKIEEVIWCYGIATDAQKDLSKICPVPIKFIYGIPDFEEVCGTNPKPRLVVLEDQINNLSAAVSNLWLRGVHHSNCSALMTSQSLYSKNKVMRDISLNTQYYVIFFSPRDRAQIQFFCRQVDPANSKMLMDAFTDATSKAHGYLLFDMKQNTSEDLRYRTNIFPGEGTVVYVRKGGGV
jgi:hypothetical protein